MNVLVTIAGAALLVYAAVTVPRNIKKARALKAQAKADVPLRIDPAAYGLVPAAQVDITRPGPDPEVDAALAAARAGDWQYAAGYLAAAGTDWDVRGYRASQLAEVAVEDDTWLTVWRGRLPGDPGAALVHAMALVKLAGDVRGSQQAKNTTAEQFDGFRRLLAGALPACQEAARLAPYDPNPWVPQISIAKGLGWSHDDFRQLWAQITARDPHHFIAHHAALQYWCEKWRGSRELMFAFAEQAAASAPRGSLLAYMPLLAIYEQALNDPDYSIYDQPFVTAAADAMLDAIDEAHPGYFRIPLVRHLLANTLFRLHRYAEAAEQFRAIGGYAGAIPWTYADEPLKRFVHVRTNTFTEWERAGRPAAPARRGAPAGY